MIESDINGNICTDCEEPMSKPASVMHHLDCTCDACCQPCQSICEDNDCAEAEEAAEGKTKIRNKLVPILANCVVLLAVIGVSGRIIQAGEINRSPENSAAAIAKVAGIPGREIINTAIASLRINTINSAIVKTHQISLIEINSFDRAIIVSSAEIQTITPNNITIAHRIDG